MRLPARVVAFSKTRNAILLDVSGGGAKLLVDGDPPQGEVLVRWGNHEAHGSLCWQRGNQCGITFDHKVPQEVLLATAALNESAALPEGADLVTASAQAWADGSAKFGFD